mmetsp:Transcript_18756/g.30311  ORF Transcript_18756/g.30311 Transcript_18756/m.30311 type:complete len:87 (+) Transcript_18756:224-484(+)
MRSSSQLQPASSFLLRRTKGGEVEEEDFHHHHLPLLTIHHHHHHHHLSISEPPLYPVVGDFHSSEKLVTGLIETTFSKKAVPLRWG